MNNIEQENNYKKAKKRIDEERGFYTHLAVYLVMNVIILFFKIRIGDFINSTDYNNFLVWNLLSTPVLWGLGLVGHGLWTFRRTNGLKKLSLYTKEWEQKKIDQYINKDES